MSVKVALPIIGVSGGVNGTSAKITCETDNVRLEGRERIGQAKFLVGQEISWQNSLSPKTAR